MITGSQENENIILIRMFWETITDISFKVVKASVIFLKVLFVEFALLNSGPFSVLFISVSM